MSWSQPPHLRRSCGPNRESHTATLRSINRPNTYVKEVAGICWKASAIYLAHGGELLPPIHDAGKNGDMAVPVKASAASGAQNSADRYADL